MRNERRRHNGTAELGTPLRYRPGARRLRVVISTEVRKRLGLTSSSSEAKISLRVLRLLNPSASRELKSERHGRGNSSFGSQRRRTGEEEDSPDETLPGDPAPSRRLRGSHRGRRHRRDLQLLRYLSHGPLLLGPLRRALYLIESAAREGGGVREGSWNTLAGRIRELLALRLNAQAGTENPGPACGPPDGLTRPT